MNSKINIHNFWRSHTFIVLVFAIMSLMSVIVMWHTKYVDSGFDLYFHWQRIYDLRASIINGNFHPLVALDQFHQTGSAVMSMYPKINLYPLVLLTFLIKSFVKLYYISFIGRNFLALLVAYFASFGYNRSKKISFIFAITYVLNSMMIFHIVQNYDIGISSSMIFIPLVMFGFMELIRHNHWIELTIGMSLIVLCHVLNSVIVSLLLLILVIINIRHFMNREKIFALVKAVVSTLLLTSIFTIPFVMIIGKNSVSTPAQISLLGGNSFWDLIFTAVDNRIDPTINLPMLLGMILGIFKYKHLGSFSKKLLWIGIGFIFVCSNFFPWESLSQTPLNNILQFSWRLYIVPEVIFSYIFAETLFMLFNKNKEANIAIIIMAISILALQMKAQGAFVNTSRTFQNIKSVNIYFGDKKISSNYEFKKVIYGKQLEGDYYPNESLPYIQQIDEHYAYDGNESFKVQSKGNGKFTFTNKKYIKNLSLPFLYYNGIDYQVKLDGKTVKEYPNKHSLMTINNVSKGKHHVQIIVHKTKAEIASYVLSFVGLVILLGTIIKSFIKKRKNE